ncbi:transglutaminase TgpA family protein [Nocardioides sp. MAHUQ-72]|uniref:transglutaminase TgpA family protein n=1 Tax=unclassified Nocardioides TaxID=2615069 RepID=UPI00360E5B74
MSPRRGGLVTDVWLAANAAATTWVAMWSWASFTMVPGRFLSPLFLLGVVVAGTGVLARWLRAPGPAVVGLQVVVSGLVCSMVISGSPLPVGAAWSRMTQSFGDAVDTANQYAAPVPSDAPGVHPLLIPGGLLCLLLVDVLVCTLRRVPLAGLPLLMIYSVPVSLVGGGVSWWVFVPTAIGFMTLLFLQESEQVARWGRPLVENPDSAGASTFGPQGAVRASAGTIGSVATALALVVPLLIPTLDLHVFDGGRGPGGGSDISIRNPMIDLRRDLSRPEDVPLVRVTTDDPAPDYLRISVLNRFSDNEWSSGDRDVPAGNTADGQMPALVGVAGTVPRREYGYEVAVDRAFASSWLPTQAPISRIVASGDWRYDTSTMDFISGDKEVTTAGMQYSMTSVDLELDAADMASAGSAYGLVSKDYLDTPTDLPPMVRTLANEVTRDAPSRYEKAVALQNWFSSTGHFTYDLHAQPGNGVDDLVAFLSTGDGGRTGYCEQFAAAMAVMARTLGIPARVAVGFLEPDEVGPGVWEYSSHDLHAWPELFIPGSGWVLFEPTPAGAGTTVPSYTTQDVPVNDPTLSPSASRPTESLPSRGPRDSLSPSESDAAGSASGGDSGFPWLPIGGGLAGFVVLAGLALLPRTVRRGRRERRLGGGIEEVWAELRATAVDLGVPWPESRSPRETRQRLVGHFGTPVDRETVERPRHGADVAPEAVAALDRLVGVLELSRYSRTPSSGDTLRTDAEACLAALHGGATRGARRRAEWWPRTVVTSRRREHAVRVQAPVQARYGGVVDHVG